MSEKVQKVVEETIVKLCEEIKTKIEQGPELYGTYISSLVEATSELIKATR